MNTRRIAEQIVNAIEEAGDLADAEVSVSVDGSNLSSSQYVEATGEDDWIKIRVATHDAKPTYERMHPSDFHVGATVSRDGFVVHHIVDHDGDWLDAVRFACKRLGLDEPSRITKAIDRRNAAIEQRKQREAEQREQTAHEQADLQRRLAVAREQLSDEDQAALAEYDTSSGKRRKNLRQSGRVRQARDRLAELVESTKAAL